VAKRVWAPRRDFGLWQRQAGAIYDDEAKRQAAFRWLDETASTRRIREEQTYEYSRWTFFAAIAAVIVGVIGVVVTLLHWTVDSPLATALVDRGTRSSLRAQLRLLRNRSDAVILFGVDWTVTAWESFMNRNIVFAAIALAFVACAAIVMAIRTPPLVTNCSTPNC
jgi:hypothetical protein